MDKFCRYFTASFCFLFSFLGSLALVDCISITRQQNMVHEALMQRALTVSHLVHKTAARKNLDIERGATCGVRKKPLVVTEQASDLIYTQVIVLDKQLFHTRIKGIRIRKGQKQENRRAQKDHDDCCNSQDHYA